MILPSFMSEKWQSYWQMSREDRAAIGSHNLAIDAKHCDNRLLPYLMRENGAYQIRDISENEQRALIISTIETNRHMGTLLPIKKTFQALGIKADIKEWFEYGGNPYRFKIDLSLENKRITTERVEELKKYVNLRKNTRSILDELVLSYQTTAKIETKIGGVYEVQIIAPTIKNYVAIATTNINTKIGGVYEVQITSRSVA